MKGVTGLERVQRRFNDVQLSLEGHLFFNQSEGDEGIIRQTFIRL